MIPRVRMRGRSPSKGEVGPKSDAKLSPLFSTQPFTKGPFQALDFPSEAVYT